MYPLTNKLNGFPKLWASTLSLLFLTLLFNFPVFSQEPQTQWIAVDDATVNQGRPIYVRGTGYYTDNTLEFGSTPQSQDIRVVVTNASHPIMNASGTDAEGRSYFTIGNVNDPLRIQFGVARGRLNYVAQIYALVSKDTPSDTEIVLNLPEEVPEGALLRLYMENESAFTSANWEVSDGSLVQDVAGFPLRGDVQIPANSAGGEFVVSVSADDADGNTAKASKTLKIVDSPAFVDFTGEKDVTPLDDVEITPIVSEDSYLTPATRAEYGYKTYVADPAQGTVVTQNTGSLTIQQGEFPGLQVGDIIAGIDENGDGFMRRVVFINGNVIATERAAFEDAFPDAIIDIDFAFSNRGGSVVASATTARGTTTARHTFSTDDDIDAGGNIGLVNFSDTIAADLGGGVTVSSTLSMNSALTFEVDYRFLRGGLISAQTMLNAGYNASTSLSVSVAGEVSFEKEKNFSPLINKKVVVYISGFPVLINIKVVPEIEAGISAAAAATLSVGVSAGGKYQAGFNYKKDSGITRVNNFTPVLTRIGPSYTLEGEISANAGVELEVSATLYEIATFSGPSVGVEAGPFAEFSVTAAVDVLDPNSFVCDIGLFIGLGSELELDYGSIGDFVGIDDPNDTNLFNIRKRVFTETECPFEPVTAMVSGFVNDQDGQPLAGATVNLRGTVSSATASTNNSGYFELEDVIVGQYTAIASKPEYKSDRNTFELDESGKELNFVLIASDDEEDPFGNENEDEYGNPGNEGSSMGDPHLRTFDGVAYDFQGAGEYTVAKSLTDDFQVQARMEPINGRTVSVNTAVALMAQGDRLGIYLIENKTAVLLNGELLDTTLQQSFTLPGGARLIARNRNVDVFWENGSQVRITGNSTWLSLRVAPSNSYFGKLSGLLGNFDGDTGNEFMTMSGEVVDVSSSFNAMYNTYGESWRVTEQSTLFDYFDNESMELFVDRTFPSNTTTERSLRNQYGNANYQAARERCLGAVVNQTRLNACVLDLLVTGEDIDLTQYQQIATAIDTVQAQETSSIRIVSPVAGQSVNSNVRIDAEIDFAENDQLEDMWFTLNGGTELNYVQYVFDGVTYSFTVPAQQFVPDQVNQITLFAKMNDTSVINAEISLYFDVSIPPQASGDILVINDLNAFDDDRIGLGDNPQFVRNMVNFNGSGIRAQGDTVVFDTYSSRCALCPSRTMFELWNDEGFTTEEVSESNYIVDTLPSSKNVKAYVIWLRTQTFSNAETSALKDFAREGGRIIYISEHAGFMTSQGIQTQNDFLAKMGASMRNLGFSRHGGNHKTTFNTEGPRHQMLTNISPDKGVYVNYVSILSVGASDYPLLYDRFGVDVIAGIATIDLSVDNPQTLMRNTRFESEARSEATNPPSPFEYEHAHKPPSQ